LRIAFGIVSLFAGGGLQRDCMEIARLIRDRGHDVVIYTSRIFDHRLAEDVPVLLLPNDAMTNHQRQYRFAVDFLRETSNHYDLRVGFDKVLGLDVLYCADASMGHRILKQPYLKLLPRYRTFYRLERDSFSPGAKTKIILLDYSQLIEFRSAWRTPSKRMILIPPTVTLPRQQPKLRANGTRAKLRSHLNLLDSDWVWMSIAVQAKTKGIDRTLEALVKFPDAKLLLAGLNETNKSSARLARHAQKLGVSSRILWLGHREDIPHLMSAADLLVHPARYDTTGTVVLEAVINGLPVVASATCGYARHVDAARAGIIVKEPFDADLFAAALQEARDPAVRNTWSAAGLEYGQKSWLYTGRERAAAIIIEVGRNRTRSSSDGTRRQDALLPVYGDLQEGADGKLGELVAHVDMAR
jgi:UDP-glucose:(heptosyl)LPS alpha-1,3-glucosyltransferase